MNKGAGGKYGKWVDQGMDKFGKPVKIEGAGVKLRVLAIPQAGMGAWAFHGWQERLPASIEMLPVELPGRNSRMAEDKGQSLGELVNGIVDALEGTLRAKPFVVLGHSLGAWMAFEVCAELYRRPGAPRPLGLVVSGCRAPHLHRPEDHDVDSISPRLAGLPGGTAPGSFWDRFDARYGRNPDLASPSVKDYVEPLLRSDFEILETYAPTRADRFECPVLACAAVGDNRIKDGQLEAWRRYAADDAAFSTEAYDASATTPPWSTPHRYLVDSPAVFCAAFGPLCEAWLAAWGPKAPLKPGAYDVSSKKGALVRKGPDLSSDQVGDLLPPATRVAVAEAVRTKEGKNRARITAPVAGWLSCSMLAKAEPGEARGADP